MSIAKKNTVKRLKTRAKKTVVVTKQHIEAKDTLFPKKVARGNKILSGTILPDPF